MVDIQSKSSPVIGENVVFGTDVLIRASSVEIAANVIFKDDITITCLGALKIGHHSMVGSGARIGCNNLTIGSWLYACDDLEIGSGGCFGKDSDVTIGDHVGIFERTLINPSSPVVIGNDVGIGREVQIWTHGAWLDPVAGFPSDFGPVTIGDNVWLPARTIMLPNSAIGDNSVIGINSVINRKIPAGSFAAGSPARVLRENAYPKPLSDEELAEFMAGLLVDWSTLIEFKLPNLDYQVSYNDPNVVLTQGSATTRYDVRAKTLAGAVNPVSEDLRDYLRRRGIKIYTDNFFRSI